MSITTVSLPIEFYFDVTFVKDADGFKAYIGEESGSFIGEIHWTHDAEGASGTFEAIRTDGSLIKDYWYGGVSPRAIGSYGSMRDCYQYALDAVLLEWKHKYIPFHYYH